MNVRDSSSLFLHSFTYILSFNHLNGKRDIDFFGKYRLIRRKIQKTRYKDREYNLIFKGDESI